PGSYVEYLQMLTEVFAECVRTLEPGGRIAVNVANLGRRPYRLLAADVTDILQNRLRLMLRGEIVWIKARAAGGSCAWGSFARPGNPVLRDLTERVIVASKGRFDRAVPAARRAAAGLPSVATISKDEFMDATTDVWEIPPESATRVQHPAPFPVELPARLIELYTYQGDVVLDPFVGAGTTAVAAARAGRRYVGYDTDEGYLRVAEERLRAEVGSGAPTVGGLAFVDVADVALEQAGLVGLRRGVKIAEGAEVAFSGETACGRAVAVDVVGGLTVARPGLRRSDAVWRTIAKAAIVQAVAPGTLFVVLTPALPGAGPVANALRNVTGAGKPIAAVVEVAPGKESTAATALAAHIA
ncbi:MAG: DNA-methyltransferase, partial [Acidimicrobiia bacterium]